MNENRYAMWHQGKERTWVGVASQGMAILPTDHRLSSISSEPNNQTVKHNHEQDPLSFLAVRVFCDQKLVSTFISKLCPSHPPLAPIPNQPSSCYPANVAPCLESQALLLRRLSEVLYFRVVVILTPCYIPRRVCG